MTLKALQEAIANLIIARRAAHGNAAEQERINKRATPEGVKNDYQSKYTK